MSRNKLLFCFYNKYIKVISVSQQQLDLFSGFFSLFADALKDIIYSLCILLQKMIQDQA